MTPTSSESLRRGPVSDLVSVARQISLALLGSLASAALGFLLTLIVTRGLGAEGAGLFFLTLAVFAIGGKALSLGADIGAVRTTARYLALGNPGAVRASLVAGLAPVLLVSVLVTAVLYVLAPTLSPYLARGSSSDEITPLFRAVIVFLPFATVSAVVLSATRGFGTMIPYTLTEQLGKPLLRPLAVGIVIAIGLDATWAGFAWAVPTAVGLVYAAIALGRLVDRLPEGPQIPLLDPTVWREYWQFASVRGIAAGFDILVRWLDVILVGAIVNAKAAGIYAAVSRLVLVGGIAQRAIILAMGPKFSALLAVDDRSRAQLLYSKSTTWLIATSFPFFLLIASFAPTVVLIFGSGFEEGATPMTILAVAMLVNMATGPATTILLMAGKASWNLGNSVGSLVINAALNVILLPRYGITGAAIAWAASVIFQNLLPAWQIFRALGLHPLGLGAAATGLGAAVLFGAGGALIQSFADPRPLVVVAAAVGLTAVYALIIWRFRRELALDAIQEALRFRGSRRSEPADL